VVIRQDVVVPVQHKIYSKITDCSTDNLLDCFYFLAVPVERFVFQGVSSGGGE
jgi:hypothetical protein